MELTTSYQLISSFNLTYGAIRTYAKYSSQSITDNTTTYQIKQVYYCNISGGSVGFDRATAVLDGTEKSYTSYTRMYSGETTIQELNRVIEHNLDGSSPTKNIATSWNATFGGSGSTNVNITFPNISRFAIMTSANNFNDEENPSFTYTNPANASMSCWLEPNPDGEHLAERTLSGTGGTYTWNLTEAERTQLRNKCTTSNSCVCRVGLYSVVNGTTYASYKDITMYIVNANPSFSVAYQDTNATTTTITGDNQKIIQNNSTLQINITNATANKGASLSTIKVSINGVDTTRSINTSTLNIDIGTVNLSANTTIPVVLTDTRGNTSQIGLNLTILSYQLPSAIINLRRKQNYYTETDITPDASYSSLDGNNTLTIQYRKKKTSDANYGAYASLTNYTTTTFNADNLYSWDIQVLLTDRIGSTTYNLTLNVGTPILFVDRQKYSVGINCLPQGNNTLELNGKDLSNTYSTSEMKIGTWIDGKPIYRKVLELSNPSSQTLADLSTYNIDYMKDIRYTTSRINTQDFNNIYQNTSEFIRIFYKTDNNTLQFRGIDVSTIYSITIILEYTKTTD